MARLKAATAAQHRATEHRPLPRALAQGALSRRQYGLLLQVFRLLEADLEARLDVHAEALAPVWGPERAKVHLLEADLAQLSAEDAALPAALEAALHAGRPGPLGFGALLGRLYVFEGSTLGGAVLCRRLAAAPELADQPLHYYRGYGPELGPMWARFGRGMNALLAPPRRQEAAIAQARATFDELGRAFEAAWTASGVGLGASRRA